jgi:hypothetical protein
MIFIITSFSLGWLVATRSARATIVVSTQKRADTFVAVAERVVFYHKIKQV